MTFVNKYFIFYESQNLFISCHTMSTKSLSKWWNMYFARCIFPMSMSFDIYWSMLRNTTNNNNTIQSLFAIRLSERWTMRSNWHMCVAFAFIVLFNKILIYFIAYLCQCPNGFSGNRCENRNYCMPNPCANNGLCTQTSTGYICSCSYPFTGTNCQQSMLTGDP